MKNLGFIGRKSNDKRKNQVLLGHGLKEYL